MLRGKKSDPFSAAKKSAEREVTINAVKGKFKSADYKKLGRVKTKGFSGKKTAMTSGGTLNGKTKKRGRI